MHAKTIHEVSTACAPTKVALAHGIAAASLREAGAVAPARRLIVGIAPNGVKEAVVHTGEAATTISVTRHLFVLADSMSEPPDVISLD